MQALIIADGKPQAPALGKKLRSGRFVIVLDGAAESVRKQGWLPDLIAGDFDSVSEKTLRWFSRRGVRLLHTPDQAYTDLEKAIAWCVLRDFRSIWITHSLGDRLDHSFTALALLRRFHGPHHELRLFQGDERVRFLRDETVKLRGRRGRRVAVLPFPRCVARSKGLAFELEGIELGIGIRESVANKARGTRVDLAIEGEALLVEEL